jgi:hypothetical protein
MIVQDIMQRGVVTVSPESKLGELMSLLGTYGTLLALATIGLLGRPRPRRAGRYPIRTSSVFYKRPKSWVCPSGTPDAALGTAKGDLDRKENLHA